MAERFDMVVIGSGPAGEKAAAQAAYFGHRVAVGEQAPRPGGAAVSSAGIPTKTLRETALYLTGFRRRDVYGLQLHLDPEATLARLRSRTAVVVGRGIVGCEYASIMTALGVEVTLVGGGRLVEFVDAELSGLLAAGFERLGMRLLLGRGRLLVDAAYRTGVPGVYAAGDVIGPPTLASAAMEQGRVAACHAFAIPFKETVNRWRPYGVYSIPEVAMVGLTEEAAAAAGVDYEVGRGWFADNARATIAGARDGLVKLVFRADDRRLLGVHVLGDTAAELVHVGQMVLHQGGGMDHFIHTTFNVPTQSEAYKYAAYDGLQRLAARA